MKNRTLFILVLLGLILLSGAIVYHRSRPTISNSGSPSVDSTQASYTGYESCRPPKADETDTAHCGFVIQTDDEKQYSLRFINDTNAKNARIPGGVKIRVTGTLGHDATIEATYGSVGLIEVTQIDQL